MQDLVGSCELLCWPDVWACLLQRTATPSFAWPFLRQACLCTQDQGAGCVVSQSVSRYCAMSKLDSIRAEMQSYIGECLSGL